MILDPDRPIWTSTNIIGIRAFYYGSDWPGFWSDSPNQNSKFEILWGPDPGRYYRLSHRSGKGIKRSKERAREREIERELHYKNAYHFHLCLTKPRHLAMAQPQSNGVDTKYLEKKKKKRRVVVWIRKPLSLLRPSCLMVAANADPPAIAGEGGDGAERRIPTHLVVMVNGLVGRCVILHLGRTFPLSTKFSSAEHLMCLFSTHALLLN